MRGFGGSLTLASVLRGRFFYFWRGVLYALGTDETFLAKAYKILSAKPSECLAHQGRVLGTVVLKQSALKLLFLIVRGNVNGLHVKRIYTRSEHDR